MPQQNLTIPYQSLAVLQNGEVLVTDVGNNQVLRINASLDAIMQKLGGQDLARRFPVAGRPCSRRSGQDIYS